MGKKLYDYSPVTKEFIGETLATESLSKPGTYLPRSNSTECPPPLVGDHEVAVWTPSGWEIKADWRGKYYRRNGEEIETVEVSEIGVNKPEDAFTEMDEVPQAVKTKEQREYYVRLKRDSLLKESDILVLRYFELEEYVPEELKAYRQALRDVPQQTGFPDGVVWPEKPETI